MPGHRCENQLDKYEQKLSDNGFLGAIGNPLVSFNSFLEVRG